MIKNISKITSLVLILFSFTIQAQNEFKANTSNSKINWKGFKPTGEHYGTIMISDGHFKVNNNQIIGGEFNINMNSIVDLDMPADNEYNAKLVKHLKSDDFFGVEKHPIAKFKITEVEAKGDQTLIKGNLTIKEITNPVSFLTSVNITNNKLTFKSDNFKIDRSKWDIKYKSKSFFENLADKFIYDDMEISIEVEADK
ncbi:YceI family protein [Flavobacteriaceae bacterium AH-315-O20]|nr:YceI family protein [Flavobacteriaceae bacterium AH-315-O20]MBN4048385.1 YceI family protein [Flavobacteriaceae bacterium AH-315-O20]